MCLQAVLCYGESSQCDVFEGTLPMKDSHKMDVKVEKLEKDFIYSYREGEKGCKVDGYFFLPPFPKLTPTFQSLNIRCDKDTYFLFTFRDDERGLGYRVHDQGACIANATNRQVKDVFTW